MAIWTSMGINRLTRMTQEENEAMDQTTPGRSGPVGWRQVRPESPDTPHGDHGIPLSSDNDRWRLSTHVA
jgi:hypothetical protein